MLNNSPIFAEKSLMDAASCLDVDSWSFMNLPIYKDCKNRQQLWKETQKGVWIIATIIDHIFDYCPYTRFVAKNLREEYNQYLIQFKQNPLEEVKKARASAEKAFEAILIQKENKISRKRKEQERQILLVFEEIQNNIVLINYQLHLPPHKDPEKPTEEEIKRLIIRINDIADMFLNELSQFSKDPFQTSRKFLMFVNPLYMAWQVYDYGWHTDFYEEGYPDSGYMLFETDIEKNTNILIAILEKGSPFNVLDPTRTITKDLLKIYRHVLKQDWKKSL